MNRNGRDSHPASLAEAGLEGGNSRETSGETPFGWANPCGNLGALRGQETMHRYTHARVLQCLAATQGAAVAHAAPAGARPRHDRGGRATC